MGVAASLIAFGCAVILTRRRLGSGVGFVLFVGCIYGWLRCQFYDQFTHFAFDSALLGLYTATWTRPAKQEVRTPVIAIRSWALVLGAIPIGVLLASPLIEGQPLLVQFVGLRAFALFLPSLVVATKLDDADVDILSDWSILCVLVATGFALAELSLGIERIFPINGASTLIYSAIDAGPGGHLRIPASFSSSHLYGGSMVALIPFVLLRLERRRRGIVLSGIALVAAAAGAFICSARIPVLTLAALVITALWVGRRRRAVVLSMVVATATISFMVASSSRFRRYETLEESGVIERRIGWSVNRGLLDVVLEKPFGQGLASSVGTSIPYFLLAEAHPQEGMESEFSRLALELGVIGLVAWVSFAIWSLALDFRTLRRFGGVVDGLMWTTCVAVWATGIIGAGVLTAVPGTFLLLIEMALVAAQRRPVSFDVRTGSPVRARPL